MALIFGYLLSWLCDVLFGTINSALADQTGPATEHDRIELAVVKDADWIGFPSGTLGDGVDVVHGPSFSLTFILLVLPGVIALIAENTGHVKAVAEMTGDDLDPYMGRAIGADGLATAFSSAFGGSPTTTYAENIGVMGATRVYSTAAYYVAAIVAILLGLCPKFGAIVAATPGGVLGGITLVLYGMIGLIGAKIWVENDVDFGEPRNLVGLAAGLIAGIGGVTLEITDDFKLSGIALGTILVIVYYHLVGVHGVPDRVRSPRRSDLSAERRTRRPAPEASVPASGHVGAEEAPGRDCRRTRSPSAECAVAGPRGPRLNQQVPTHQLVVADATLRGRDGRWQIGIDDGLIAALGRDTLSGREELDAGGSLVTESFVNGHMHLDKVYTLDRIGDAALTAYTSGEMGSALHSIELASRGQGRLRPQVDRAERAPGGARGGAVRRAPRAGLRRRGHEGPARGRDPPAGAP